MLPTCSATKEEEAWTLAIASCEYLWVCVGQPQPHHAAHAADILDESLQYSCDT
jgi:hypothetical protein